jgi:ATP-dependent 26S proteasome regulatory subunit
LASGELLRQFFRATAAGDATAIHAAAEAMVDEERAKNHNLLADDLDRILRNGKRAPATGSPWSHVDIPKDRERGFPLVDISSWDYPWERLVAPSSSLAELRSVADENARSDVLAAAGLAPRRRLLLVGPPGCGKTLAARCLASAVHAPLVVVRFDALISSYLGETSANLRRVFEFLGRDRFVALFDEFDAIGKERDNPTEHGELKRVVNAFLQLVDAYAGDSILIAATNHSQMLDSAIWRRFDTILRFDLPRPQDRVLMLRLFLRGFETTGVAVEGIAKSLQGASGADLEQIAQSSARAAVLDGRVRIRSSDLNSAVSAYRRRASALGGQA